ncbi:MAG TPA: MazG nucleotide pyrophosphohydrolase domain-containing protein [Candidatus Saccharimonadales bacterium]|nr:MazG nucleotide pyrophosphohydrolase domain-containing protein [Candidatus Saccharimonadales bacterium]
MADHPVLKPRPTLADIQNYIGQANTYRAHRTDLLYCMLLLCEETGELAKAVRKHIGGKMDVAKPEAGGAEEEAADVFWLLVAVCNALGIDLEQALRDKEEKNKMRIWK